MSDWRPISSAPTDREILIYDCFYGGRHIAYKESWGWVAKDEQKDDICPILWMEIPCPSQELINAHSPVDEEEDKP